MGLPRAYDIHPLQHLARIKQGPPKQQLRAMMDLEYPADPVLEPDLVGLTYGQVALFKQVKRAADYGDGQALDRVLDRMIGKPVSQNVNMNTTVTYQDFLDGLARDDGDDVIDVEPSAHRNSDEIS